MNVYKESSSGEYKLKGELPLYGTKTVSAGTSDYVWVLVEATGSNPFVNIEMKGGDYYDE
jgi:hypothetical protein